MSGKHAQEASVVVAIKERFGFVDQFRGLVILLFVIADITWQWSGAITGIPPILPVGPTWLNHGWKFFNFADKQMITLVDIGQLLFIFVMGMMIPVSWKRHLKRGGMANAIGQLAIRLGWFYLIAGVMGGFDLRSMFITNTFAILAMAMLLANVAAAIVKSPKNRQYLNLVLIAVFTAIYPFQFQYDTIPAFIPGVIPLHFIGATIVAIQGGIFMEMFKDAADGEERNATVKTILKMSTIAAIGAFIIDYFWWADHHDMNTSLTLIAISTGGFLFVIFYWIEQHAKWKVPGLDSFGRNTLLVFMLAYPIQTLANEVLDLAGTFKTAPWPVSPLVALGSLVLQGSLYLAVLLPLNYKRWYFTPSIFIRAVQHSRAKKAAPAATPKESNENDARHAGKTTSDASETR